MTERLTVSAAEALTPAFQATKRILFEPFDYKKWLVLGFSAFLANLGQQGGGFNGNPFGGRGGRGGPGVGRMLDWVDEHLVLIAVIAAGLILIGIALGALFTWLSSRGQFMFLDCIARNRAEVEAPWRRFKELGNNLFVFRFVLGLIGLACVVVILAVAWLLARPDISARRFGGSALAAVLVGGILLFAVVLVLAVINLLLNDFVIPIMYKREVGTVMAFGMLRASILPGHFWSVVLYYLLKLAIGIAAGIAMVVVMFATCFLCLTGCIPILNWYASSVVFLPIWVFFRCYSLCFLEQYGEGWRILPPAGPPPSSIPAPWEEAPAGPAQAPETQEQPGTPGTPGDGSPPPPPIS